MKKIVQALLITTSCVALSGCFEPEGSKDRSKTEAEAQYLKYIEKLEQQPLNVKTVSGGYLVSQHAQLVNDWETASKYLNQVIQESRFMSPGERESLEKKAMILSLGSGEIKSAEYYAKKLSGDDESPLSLLVLAIPHIKSEDYKAAREIIARMPEDGMSNLIRPIILNWMDVAQNKPLNNEGNENEQEHYHLILAADVINDTEALKTLSGEALPKDGVNIQSLITIADILVRQDLLGRALSLYQDIQSQLPATTDLVEKIRLLQNGQDVPADLLAPAVKTPAEGIARAVLDIGMLLFQEKSFDSAKIFAHMALDIYPDLEDANLLLAYVASQYEQYDQAIEYFRTIPKTDIERYYQAQQQVADLQERRGDLKEALKTLDKLSIVDDSPDLQTQIGDIARRDEQYKRALKAYNKAFELLKAENPDAELHWSLYYSRGIVHERLKQWPKAEQDLKKALEIEPNHPYVLNYLGYSWADQGKNLDEAQEMILKAVTLRPDDGYIVDSLGWVYYKVGDYEKSIPPLEMAVELLPMDPTINDHLGDAYWKVGRKHEARFQWKRALSFAQESPDNLSEEEVIELMPQLKEKIKSGLKNK